MKTRTLILKFFCAAALLATSLTPVFAETSRSIGMTMKQYTNSIYVEEEEPGRRTPTRRLDCTITEDGIFFTDAETPEFVSYDILDTAGMTVATFADEESFISTLFSLSGEYQLRLVSDNYIYVGWVKL